MSAYTITPEERRARAKAIVEHRNGLARQKQAYRLQNIYAEQERSRLAAEKVEQEKIENANGLVRALSTFGDINANIATGVIKSLEGIVDLGISAVGAVGGIFSDDFRDTMREAVSFDFTGELIATPYQEAMKYSYLNDWGKGGEIVEQVANGVGQMLPAVIATLATAGAYGGFAAGATTAEIAAAQTAAQTASLVTMGLSAAGNSTEEAFNEGANYYAGLGYGVASGLVEVGTEKMFGGLNKALTGAGILDGITKSVADTGIKRIAKGAIEEGLEEMTSEAVSPFLKTIYKGKDAFEDYSFPEHLKQIGEAGAVGSLTALAYSGSVGYGLSKFGYGYTGKDADISDSLSEIGSLREKAINMQAEDTLDAVNERKIAETTKKNYQNIEGVLKSVSEAKRKKLIEKFSLENAFNDDGGMSDQIKGWFDENASQTESDLKKSSYSVSLRGKEDIIGSDIEKLSERRAQAYLEERQAFGENVTVEQARETVGNISVLKSEMSEKAQSARRKFNKALNVLNKRSGLSTAFVITEANNTFDGALIDNDRMYISADAFENDTWAATLVHEYTHLEEGSEEYAKMVDFLQSDDLLVKVEMDGEVKMIPLWQKAQAAVLGKDYGFDENKIKVINEKINAQVELTAEESKLYRAFLKEVAAHETQYLLGTESFIDKIIATDRSFAKKMIDRIFGLKEAFAKVSDRATKAQLKMLRRAEKLYLEAARKAGDMQLVRYILSRSPELEKEVDKDAQIVYNKKASYKQISKEEYAIISSRIVEDNSKYIARDQELPRYGRARSADYFYVYENFEPGNFGVLKQIEITDANREYIAYIEAMIGENDGERIIGSADGIYRVLEVFKTRSRRNRGNNALASGGRSNGGNGRVSLGESASDGIGYSKKSSGHKRGVSSASKRRVVRYIPYNKIGNDAIRHIRSELQKFYGGENGIADVVAIEYGEYVYTVDSGRENGELKFGVRAKKKLCNAELRAEYIRSINDVGLSKGYVSNELSSKIGSGSGVDSGRDMRRESRPKLRADTRESQNNGGRALGEVGDTGGLNISDDVLRFKLSETSEQKKYSYELTGNKVKKLANATGLKVYSKAEAEEIINHVLENYVVFGDAYGTLSGKSAAEAVDMLWRGLNTAEVGKRMKVALDMAEYVIKHAAVKSMYDDVDLEMHKDTVALLKPYLHKMNLDGIKGEIKHRYGNDNSPYLLWGKRKGESGLGVDVIAMELDDLGLRIDAVNEADIFFSINETYKSALVGLKKEAKSMLELSLNTEERKQLKQDIARQVLIAFDEKGSPSALSKLIVEYTDKVNVWRERYYGERNRNKAINRVLDKTQKLKDLKLGTFLNASQYKSDVFKSSIERLANIKYRGDLNENGTRAILEGLSEWYVKGNPMLQSVFDEEISDVLQTLGKGEGKLTVDELRALGSVIDYFKHFVETYNKVWRNGKYEDALPIAEKYVSKLQRNEPAKVGWIRKLFENYLTVFGDPMTVMRYMDRYENGFWTDVYEKIRRGLIDASIMEAKIRKPLEAFYKKHKEFLKDISVKTVEYQGTQIPLAEAMLLYMSLSREQAILGLAKSGFAYADGDKIIHLAGFALEEELEDAEIRAKAKKVQAELADQFTETEREYISTVEKIFNEDCKEAKKKTDILRRGYTNVLDAYYVPIRRENVSHKVDEGFYDEITAVSNYSFNRDTVKGARSELRIEALNVVLDRHIRAVSRYANLALAVDRYDILYNLDVGGDPNKPTSVKTASANVWLGGEKYFKKLFDDIKGVPASKDGVRFIGKIRSGYARYQLGANPKVLVTQLSSFAAAISILDADCVIRGIGIRALDVDEYCGLAEVRNTENAAALAQGLLEKTGKIGDVLMVPIGKVDRFVVTRLFGACQLQIEKNEGLKLGTLENKQRAGELLEKVIIETQQNALTTERSSAMRSGSEFMKAITMFSADSMKVTGRVVDALGELSVLKAKRKLALSDQTLSADAKKSLSEAFDGKIKTAGKNARRAVASIVSSAVLMAAAAQFFRWLYNRDDKDDVAENMLVDAVGNLLGGLPGIRDVVSFFTEGYEIDNYAYSAINDMLSSAVDIFDTVGDVFSDGYDQRKIASSVKKLLYAAGQITGIPTRNIYNVCYGLTKRISPSAAYRIDGMFYEQSYRSDLAKAIESGDENMIATITSLMIDENIGELEDQMSRKALDALIREGYDVIPKSVGNKITYDGVEYTLTSGQEKRFKKVYGVANEALAQLVRLAAFKEASDGIKASAIKYIYKVYYDLAIQDLLGVDIETKSVLFAEVIDVEKLALIVAAANSFTADRDGDGKVVSGTRKAKLQKYVNSLQLKAAEKYMVMGYLGYTNTKGETQVKAYIDRLSLTKTEKAKLLEYSGYAA